MRELVWPAPPNQVDWFSSMVTRLAVPKSLNSALSSCSSLSAYSLTEGFGSCEAADVFDHVSVPPYTRVQYQAGSERIIPQVQ